MGCLLSVLSERSYGTDNNYTGMEVATEAFIMEHLAAPYRSPPPGQVAPASAAAAPPPLPQPPQQEPPQPAGTVAAYASTLPPAGYGSAFPAALVPRLAQPPAGDPAPSYLSAALLHYPYDAAPIAVSANATLMPGELLAPVYASARAFLYDAVYVGQLHEELRRRHAKMCVTANHNEASYLPLVNQTLAEQQRLLAGPVSGQGTNILDRERMRTLGLTEFVHHCVEVNNLIGSCYM